MKILIEATTYNSDTLFESAEWCLLDLSPQTIEQIYRRMDQVVIMKAMDHDHGLRYAHYEFRPLPRWYGKRIESLEGFEAEDCGYQVISESLDKALPDIENVDCECMAMCVGTDTVSWIAHLAGTSIEVETIELSHKDLFQLEADAFCKGIE